MPKERNCSDGNRDDNTDRNVALRESLVPIKIAKAVPEPRRVLLHSAQFRGRFPNHNVSLYGLANARGHGMLFHAFSDVSGGWDFRHCGGHE